MYRIGLSIRSILYIYTVSVLMNTVNVSKWNYYTSSDIFILLAYCREDMVITCCMYTLRNDVRQDANVIKLSKNKSLDGDETIATMCLN